jgi:Lipoprotein amino terminal region
MLPKFSGLWQQRLLWTGAVALVCVVTGGFFALRPSAASSPSASHAATAPTILVEAPERVFRPGTIYRYSLSSEQAVEVRAEQPGDHVPPPMHFLVKGEWRVGVCDVNDTSVNVRITLSVTDVSADTNGTPFPPEVHRELREALSIPFFITLDKSGMVQKIHFEPGVDVIAQGLLRSVVAMTQVILPSAKRASWEANEEDTLGRYVADYRLGPSLRADKRKLRYTDIVLSEDGLEPLVPSFKVELTSQSTLTLAREDLWLESLQGQESVTIAPGAGETNPGGHTLVELRLLGRGSEPSLVDAFARHRNSLVSQPLASIPEMTPQDFHDQYRRRLAGRTLSDFAPILHKLPEEQKARREALQKALDGLYALFTVEPTAATEVPGLLRTASEPDAVSTMLGALASAATKEALSALSQIMDDPKLTEEVRAGAANEVGGTEAPTEQSIASLWRLIRGTNVNLHQIAILALGSAAMHLHEKDAPAADALVAEICQAALAARGEEEQDLWLGALGNTRSPQALPALRPFLVVAAATLRASATQSLRFMPAPDADRLLSDRLLSDLDAQVRRAAVLASSFRPLAPLLPTMKKALEREREASVRTEIVHLLSEEVSPSPGAQNLLMQTSQQDPDASVRDAAAKALAGRRAR